MGLVEGLRVTLMCVRACSALFPIKLHKLHKLHMSFVFSRLAFLYAPPKLHTRQSDQWSTTFGMTLIDWK